MIRAQIRRGARPPDWPRFFTTELITQFTQMGWTAQDWHGVDQQAALKDGPVTWPAVSIGPRSEYNLREWLRHPPDHCRTPITPALVRETLARYEHLAPNVLTAYADGASARFVAAFADRRAPWFRHNFPDGRPDVAWDNAGRANLSEPEAVGWALTGGLIETPEMVGQLDDDQVARLIFPWVRAFGPTAYLFVLAGLTLEEAVGLKDTGATPGEEQLRVMVALNGVVLPAGV